LEAYDRNQNFSNVVDIQSVAADVWPDDLQFRQLTLSHRNLLRALSSEMVEHYFTDTPTAAAGCIKSEVDGCREGLGWVQFCYT